MSERLERSYLINGKGYWEDDLEMTGEHTLYLINGNFYNRQQLRGMSIHRTSWYNMNDLRFNKDAFDNILSKMSSPNSLWSKNGHVFTRQQLEEVMKRFPTPAPTADPPEITSNFQGGTRGLGDSRSETTQTASSNEGIDPPHTQDEEEDDELAKKALASLRTKIQAIKQRKKVAVEVEKLRKLLAEKEAYLVECDRIIELEVGQVS